MQLAESNSTALPVAACASALFNNDFKDLEQRVKRLLDQQLSRGVHVNRGAATLVMIVGLLVSILLGFPVLRAEKDRRELTTVKGFVDARADIPREVNAIESDVAMDLSGTWKMHLPAGFVHRIKLDRIDQSHYRLSPTGLNMSGIYELQGTRLVIQQPNNRRLTEFQWEIRDADRLALVAQPPLGKTGANYLGATMARK